MKISTRGRYGLKAMIDLASHYDIKECVSLKSIANRQGIPDNYLEQLMVVLKKAGLVTSVRGAQGGYILNKSPEEISVGDLLNVLEGSTNLVACLDNTESVKARCGTAICSECKAKDAWEIISRRLSQTANSIYLKDIINEQIDANYDNF